MRVLPWKMIPVFCTSVPDVKGIINGIPQSRCRECVVMWICQPIIKLYKRSKICYTYTEFSIQNPERCGVMFTVTINDRGQITIPKELRAKANLKPKDNLEIQLDGQGRLIITKKDILSDLEDLIRRDLVSEGRSAYDVEILVSHRKKELGKALLKMSAEAEAEIAKGECTSLEQLKADLDTEGQ